MMCAFKLKPLNSELYSPLGLMLSQALKYQIGIPIFGMFLFALRFQQ